MVADSNTTSKPIVVTFCPPYPRHINPLLTQATHLLKGYEIHFIVGPDSETSICKISAIFHPVQTTWTDKRLEQMLAIPDGPESFVFGFKGHFLDLTPNAMKALQRLSWGLACEIRRHLEYRDHPRDHRNGCVAVGRPFTKGIHTFHQGHYLGDVTVDSIWYWHCAFLLPPNSSEEGRAWNAAMNRPVSLLRGDVAEIREQYMQATWCDCKNGGPNHGLSR